MLPSARTIGLILEWSCHGVPWLVFSVVWLLGVGISSFMPGRSAVHTDPYIAASSIGSYSNWRSATLLVALLLDIVIVGVVKFIVKRPRPEMNFQDDMLLTVSIDDWSFPSGHASRVALLQWLLRWLFFQTAGHAHLLLGAWAAAVCVSRLLIRRHHIGDVIFGYFLGLFEYWLITHVNWAYWFRFLG